MKFYESTSFFLRVAVFRFRSKAYPNTEIVLLPVCHVGSSQFYDKITEIVNELDVLLYEGSKMNKLSLSREIGTYTKLAAKLGLVSQYGYMSYKKMKPRLVHADVTAEQAKILWRNLSRYEKLKYRIITPIKSARHTRNLTRRKMVEAFRDDMERSYLFFSEEMNDPKKFEYFTFTAREQVVFEKIKEVLAQETSEERTVGIIYGAAHMNAISRFMIDELGYIARDSEFVTVFDL